MSQKVYNKTLQNHAPYTWFDWIANKSKTYECRIRREDWIGIKLGDVIVFREIGGDRQMTTRVVDLVFGKDFADLFGKVGQKMIPVDGMDAANAKEIYAKIFGSEKDKKDIAEFGVVAVGIDVIN